jgi:hypothetical protein
MFRTVFPSIIRSLRLHIQQHAYVQCFARINNLRNRCIFVVFIIGIYYDARTYERHNILRCTDL